jgi:hypothetical protein
MQPMQNKNNYIIYNKNERNFQKNQTKNAEGALVIKI